MMTSPLSGDASVSTAKEEAKGVAQEAASSAGAVGNVAKNEAANVAHEAKYQAKDLLHQSRQELMDQATVQQERAAKGLRSLHEELNSMAEKSEGSGVGTDLVHQAAQRAGSFAEYLEQRDPGSLVSEVTSFARRRPGAFLAIAAGAGLLVGRLTRSLAAGAPGQSGQSGVSGPLTATPATPAGHGVSPTTAYPGEYPQNGFAEGTGTVEGMGYPEGTGYPAGSTPPVSSDYAAGAYEPGAYGTRAGDTYGSGAPAEYDEGAVQEGAVGGSPAYGAPTAPHATAAGADMIPERDTEGEDTGAVTDGFPPVPRHSTNEPREGEQL
jgi:hypothetical protein